MLINRKDTIFYRTKNKRFFKAFGLLSFVRNFSSKYRKQSLDAGINASKKVIHEAAKVTGELLEDKIAHAVNKSNDVKIMKKNL